MSLKCYFHPDREASTKCEKCEKMLCIECKKPYTATHGVSESRYATQHDMCKPCYYDIEMQRYTISSRGYYIAFCILVPIILTLVILYLVFLSLVGFMAFVFLAGGLVPTFLFVCLLLNFIVGKKRAPAKLEELKAKKE